MREYDDYIRIMLKKGDRENIQRRMKEAGIVNMSAYIRKIAIDGCIIQVDLGNQFEEVLRLTKISTNNLNQYAKRANETGSIYQEDIKEIKDLQEKIWNALKEVLEQYKRWAEMR